MKLIIAGGRELYLNNDQLDQIIEEQKFPPITEVVSGGAPGIDSCGESWAESRGILIKRFPADWDKHGKAAGPIRNREMAEYGDRLLAIPGAGRGTESMIREMAKLNKPYSTILLRPSQAKKEGSL